MNLDFLLEKGDVFKGLFQKILFFSIILYTAKTNCNFYLEESDF